MARQHAYIKGWIPARLIRVEQEILCKWIYAGDIPFSDPFFDETLAKCMSHPFNSKGLACVSSMTELPVLADTLDAVSPSAIIFHISRCGSTLVSQMLGCLPESISLAEVPFLDDILRSGALSTEQKEQALDAAVRLYGQKRKGNEKQLFIKLDSWHVFYYDAFRKLYPDVPFVFLYRDPYEVLQSHGKHRGMQAVPGVIEPAVFGLSQQDVSGLSLDEYTAKVLEKYFEAYLRIAEHDRNTTWIDYKQGASHMIRQMVAVAGQSWTAQDIQQMEERSRYHSKHPSKAFHEALERDSRPAYLQAATSLYQALDHQLKLVRQG